MARVLMSVALFLAVLTLESSAVASNGYKIFGVQGAKAAGQAEAFVAQADDPSAIAFNPAGLTQLKGTHLSTGVTAIRVATEWTATSPNLNPKENNIDEWQFVPDLFLASDLGMKKLAFGAGLTVPFGLTSRWSETGFARYVSTTNSLRVINFNPTIAYEIIPELSVGAGFSYYSSQAVMKNKVDYGFLIGAPGALDGASVLRGQGHAFGWNLGTLYKINERNSLGFSYRSPFSITYRGHIDLSEIPAFRNMGDYVNSPGEADIHYPAVISGGYAFKPIEKLKLEFDLEWVRWQSYDVLAVAFADPRLADTSYVYEWKNAFNYKFGTEYKLNDNLELRCGYQYAETAVPEHTFRPSLTDADKHYATAGIGIKRGNFKVDIAGVLIFYEDREINNNVDRNETTTGSTIDGIYKSFGGIIAANLTYKF